MVSLNSSREVYDDDGESVGVAVTVTTTIEVLVCVCAVTRGVTRVVERRKRRSNGVKKKD